MPPFSKFAGQLDPNGQLDYLFKISTSTGEALVTATVAFVDSTDTALVSGVPLIVGTPAPVLISAQLYGVTVWLDGNGVPPGEYRLRLRGVTDSTPPRKFDRTMLVVVAHT